MTPAFGRPPVLRREALRIALPGAVDLLGRGRAGDIAVGYVDDYVALRRMEWHGGGLRLTTTGSNVSERQIDRLE